MKQPSIDWRGVVAALILCIYVAIPAPAPAGNEGDAWDQLQSLLENTTADHVKPLADAIGGGVSPSQLLDGMRAIEAIEAGDWKNAGENTAGFIIGLFSATFGGYLSVHKAAREAGTAIIENWVQDLYEHPAYKGVVTVLNDTVIASAKAGTPYLPSYLAGSNPSIQAAMRARETRMYESWVERPEYDVESLVTGEWASRIRQDTGRANMSGRQVFNAFLVKAVQDQKGFILTTFQRVSMKAGAAEARRALEEKARTILVKMNPPPRDVSVSMEKGRLMAGEDIIVHYAYRVGDGALHSARLEVKNAAGKVVVSKTNDKAQAGSGHVRGKVSMGKVPPNVYGKFKVEMTIANIYGKSQTARAFFEIVRDEAKAAERLAYVKTVAAAVQEAARFDISMDVKYREAVAEWNEVQELERRFKEKDQAVYDEIEARRKALQRKSDDFDARWAALFKAGNPPPREVFDREKAAIMDEIEQWRQYRKDRIAGFEQEWEPIGKRKFAVIEKNRALEKRVKERWPHLAKYSGNELIAKLKEWSNLITALNVGLKTALAKNDLAMAEAAIQKYGVVVNTVMGGNR